MGTFSKILILIVIIGCQSPQTTIETIDKLPDKPEVEPTLQQVKIEIKKEETKKNQSPNQVLFLRKVENALEDCKIYSNRVEQSYSECNDLLKSKNELINNQTVYTEKLKSKITNLENELSTWRKIKWTVIITIGLILFIIAIRFLSPIILGFAKRSLGI